MFGNTDKMAAPDVDEAVACILPMFGLNELKPEQTTILKCLISKKDCVGVLPTGFGKSLPFQIYLPVKRKLHVMSQESEEIREKVLVVCPLISLMEDQVSKLSKVDNLSAAYIGSSFPEDNKIREGLIDIVYGTPESFLGDPVWRSSLQMLDVSTIVIDEFHTISTWGDDDVVKKQAFRKWFASVGELRSLFPSATLLALSATCTNKIRRRVMKVLQLKEDTIQIDISPNKSNIKIVAFKIPNTIEMSLCWLAEGLDQRKEAFPRTLLYCVSINDASKIYTYLTQELPHCAHFIEMYHSETPTSNKEQIIDSLKDQNGILRLVIATSALGMGIDVKNCHSIILFGPPNNLVDLVQESGRAGRDELPSISIILYNAYHLRGLSAEVKDVLKTDKCRRSAILKHFLKPDDLKILESEETGLHSCCDLCAKKCNCENCNLLEIEKIFNFVHSDYGDDVASDSDDTESYDWSETDSEVEIPL